MHECYVDRGWKTPQVRFFVMDEADRLADNNPSEVGKIFKRLPQTGHGINRLQVLCFLIFYLSTLGLQ